MRIESVQNERVKQWKKLHTKKGRKQQQKFLIEGPHLIEEALKENETVLEIIIVDSQSLPKNWGEKQIPVRVVTNQVFKVLSETENSQGVIAVCRKRTFSESFRREPGKYLLIDSVQDPGNVGTIIRTADSAGFDAVILGKGTVDPFNSKVIRATQGSLFHIPIIERRLEGVIDELKQNDVTIYGTALRGAEDYRHVSGTNRSFALLIGNEGQGVAEHLLERCDRKLSIPVYGKAESLNVAVAAGILMYALRG